MTVYTREPRKSTEVNQAGSVEYAESPKGEKIDDCTYIYQIRPSPSAKKSALAQKLNATFVLIRCSVPDFVTQTVLQEITIVMEGLLEKHKVLESEKQAEFIAILLL